MKFVVWQSRVPSKWRRDIVAWVLLLIFRKHFHFTFLKLAVKNQNNCFEITKEITLPESLLTIPFAYCYENRQKSTETRSISIKFNNSTDVRAKVMKIHGSEREFWCFRSISSLLETNLLAAMLKYNMH